MPRVKVNTKDKQRSENSVDLVFVSLRQVISPARQGQREPRTQGENEVKEVNEFIEDEVKEKRRSRKKRRSKKRAKSRENM